MNNMVLMLTVYIEKPGFVRMVISWHKLYFIAIFKLYVSGFRERTGATRSLG